jgi:hypothetical protein
MARQSLLEKGVCQSGHIIKSEKDLYINPYNNTREGYRIDKRCKACQQDRARLISRKKRGITPLDAPVRYYTPQKPKPKPIEWVWQPT